jgi:tRNA nucleotidyltransferase/poly(A) polymerase
MSIKFDWRDLSNVENKVREELEKQNRVLQGILDERKTISESEAKTRSKKKYFNDPALEDDNGKKHKGWDQVLPVLKEKEGQAVIEETNVDIELKLKNPQAPTDNDLAMKIRTKFKFEKAQGSLDPMIAGELFHRRTCDFESDQ